MSISAKDTLSTNFSMSNNTVCYEGEWTITQIGQQEKNLQKLPPSSQIIFDGSKISSLDTAGAWLIYRTQQTLQQQNVTVSYKNFTSEQMALFRMIADYSIQLVPCHTHTFANFLVRIGKRTYSTLNHAFVFLSFVGETSLALLWALLFPHHIRWKALFSNIQTAGIQALPIVGLMAFLMGVVLAYQGGVQLSQYGANIFVVDLVSVTLFRELAPLLTAIIIAGRSGSSYTAQISTMHITEEIDALRTLGITPMELLVLPKLLALILVLPLLSVFSNILGLIGAMSIAQLALDVSINDFFERLQQAIDVRHYLVGLSKAPVFAAIIALVGCYQGLQVQGGADSVGKQVTKSVVQAIFLVIIADAIFSILFSWFGI